MLTTAAFCSKGFSNVNLLHLHRALQDDALITLLLQMKGAKPGEGPPPQRQSREAKQGAWPSPLLGSHRG